MNQAGLRTVSLVALVSAAACVALMLARAHYAVSFTEPLQGQTRGVEYEPLFSIWSYLHGRPVYTDQHAIPFTASFYNWLFYAVYAEVSRAAMALLDLGDAWLPTIARLISLATCAVGAWLTWWSMVRLFEVRERALTMLGAAFAAFIWFGPLIGFFGIAPTPDFLPLAVNVVAIHLFVRLYEGRRLTAILLVCLLSFVCWSFKQNFLYLPAAVGTFLLWRRDWTGCVLLAVLPTAAAVATLLIGGPTFARMVYFAGTSVSFSFDLLVRNVVNFTVKSAPLLAGLAVGFVALARSAKARHAVIAGFRARPALAVPFIGIFFAGLEGVATSGLNDAAENHLFPLSWFLGVGVFALIVWTLSAGALRAASLAVFGAGWLANVAAIGLVFLGIHGVLSVRPYHERIAAARDCLQELPRPVYVYNPYMALPWITPAAQPFVVYNAYRKDRATGVEMEAGGIGGLIARGYFGAVVIPPRDNGMFDGAALDAYELRPEACAGFAVYVRTGAETGRAGS